MLASCGLSGIVGDQWLVGSIASQMLSVSSPWQGVKDKE